MFYLPIHKSRFIPTCFQSKKLVNTYIWGNACYRVVSIANNQYLHFTSHNWQYYWFISSLPF
jgi:hypothetical protein